MPFVCLLLLMIQTETLAMLHLILKRKVSLIVVLARIHAAHLALLSSTSNPDPRFAITPPSPSLLPDQLVHQFLPPLLPFFSMPRPSHQVTPVPLQLQRRHRPRTAQRLQPWTRRLVYPAWRLSPGDHLALVGEEVFLCIADDALVATCSSRRDRGVGGVRCGRCVRCCLCAAVVGGEVRGVVAREGRKFERVRVRSPLTVGRGAVVHGSGRSRLEGFEAVVGLGFVVRRERRLGTEGG